MIGKQLTGEAAPWDFGAVEAFERNAGKGISLLAFSAPVRRLLQQLPHLPLPKLAMETLREHGTIPFLSWASQAVPSSPSAARLQPLFDHQRLPRRLHP